MLYYNINIKMFFVDFYAQIIRYIILTQKIMCVLLPEGSSDRCVYPAPAPVAVYGTLATVPLRVIIKLYQHTGLLLLYYDHEYAYEDDPDICTPPSFSFPPASPQSPSPLPPPSPRLPLSCRCRGFGRTPWDAGRNE